MFYYMKGLIIISYLFSLILFFNLSSMFTLWITLEINLTFFSLLLLSLQMEVPSTTSDELYSSLLYYFILQTLSSMFLILGTTFISSTYYYFGSFVLVLILIFKMGLFPFHFWVYSLSYFISYSVVPILLVLQKIPFFVLLASSDLGELLLFILLGAFVGSFFLINSYTLKDLLVSSSVYSSLWVLLSLKCSFFLFLFFMIFYYIFLYLICSGSSRLNNSSNFLFSIPSSMFFLMGLPPFPLFFFKYYSLELFLFDISMLGFMVLWLSSFLSLVGYFNYMYNSIFIMKSFWSPSTHWSMNVYVLSTLFLISFFLI